jgi:hypothetical protein
MSPDEIVRFVEDDLGGTIVLVASEANGAPEVSWGDTFFIYDPDSVIPPERQFPYATIVNSDVPGFDEASNLARDGVFRVNIWVSRPTFEREAEKETDPDQVDYAALDRVIPHPVYGAQSWLSVLNPADSTSDKVKALLSEAHGRAGDRYAKKYK